MNVEQLKREMRDLELAHGVRFNYIAEIGSRAWGYANDNSDYDIKAFYVQLPWERDLLDGLETFREAFVIDGVKVDVQAMELRKVMGNIVRSDASTIEAFRSPLVYAHDGSLQKIDELILAHYNAGAVWRVFLDLAAANLYPKRNKEFNGKSAIQALRFSLMAEQIAEYEDTLFQPRLQDMTDLQSLYGSLGKILNTVQMLNEKRDETDLKSIPEVASIFSLFEVLKASDRPGGSVNRDTEQAQKLYAGICRWAIDRHEDRNSDHLVWETE